LASKLGILFSSKERPQRLDYIEGFIEYKTNGYHTVKLYLKGKSYTKYVHDVMVIPRRNGVATPGPDKSNNRADKLVWGTRRENIWDRIKANGRTEDWNIFPTRSKKHPFMVHMTPPGGKLKHCGMFSSKQEARIKRDMLSLEFYAQCLCA
jgi:hypothetical protein